MSPDRSTIANSVATACTESAGTVQALAEEVGVSYAALCSWSRGRRRPPPHRLEKLADVLDDRAERLTVVAQQLREQAGVTGPKLVGQSGDGASHDARERDAVSAPPAERPAMAASPSTSEQSAGRNAAGDGARGPRSWRTPGERYEPRRERDGSIPLPPPTPR